MRVNSIRIEGNNPFRSTIQSSVSLKMENGHLCLFPCFTGLAGDGWIAARRRREATAGDGMDGRAAMVPPCGNPLALRLPGSHGGRADADASPPTVHAHGAPGSRLQAPRSQWHAGPRLQDHRKAERPVPRGGELRWEDRRSIPDGCGQHVPGLDGHRVTPLLRAPASRTIHRDRDQGVWSRLGLSGLESRHLQRHTTL